MASFRCVESVRRLETVYCKQRTQSHIALKRYAGRLQGSQQHLGLFFLLLFWSGSPFWSSGRRWGGGSDFMVKISQSGGRGIVAGGVKIHFPSRNTPLACLFVSRWPRWHEFMHNNVFAALKDGLIMLFRGQQCIKHSSSFWYFIFWMLKSIVLRFFIPLAAFCLLGMHKCFHN